MNFEELQRLQSENIKSDENLNITKIAFFGTSLTEHLEAYTPAIYEQMELPEINSYTLVTAWRKRGFVSMLENRIMISKPHLNVKVYNYGKGGANSFEVIEEIKKKTSEGEMFDLSFLECGANDILRKFQNRLDEAVDIDTFRINYRNAIELLISKSRSVVCLSMTTVNSELKDAMNRDIFEYNKEMKKLSQEYKCLFIDNFSEFSNVYQKMNSESRCKLWSDKLHLSELGDTVIANLIFNELEKSNLLDSL